MAKVEAWIHHTKAATIDFTEQYPWLQKPVIVGAPMRLIALPPLAIEISATGGFGFIGAGDALEKLDGWLQDAADLIAKKPDLAEIYRRTNILPIGVGFFNWAPAESIDKLIEAVKKFKPAAVWQFGAFTNAEYANIAQRVREASNGVTKVWIQVGSAADAVEVVEKAQPDVLVVQGTDAGGHGLETGASIMTLLLEVQDQMQAGGQQKPHLIAAGGIVDGRGTAAAMTLGANGVCLGTRFLASEEATIARGYQQDIIRASDGGVSTARTKVYDQLRGTTAWPKSYNARGILNQSFHDSKTLSFEENKRMYDDAVEKGDLGWGVEGRMTTYAGTGVGLIKEVKKAGDIVREIQQEAAQCLGAFFLQQ